MIESAKKLIKLFNSLLIIILIGFSFRIFIAEPFHIPSGSMKSTLLIGDRVIATKYNYGYSSSSFPIFKLGQKVIRVMPLNWGMFWRHPQRGDIIAFRPPRTPQLQFVKRVIGVPGDKVQIIDDEVFVNGKRLQREKLVEYKKDGRKIVKYQESNLEGGHYDILLEDNVLPEWFHNTPQYEVPSEHFFVMGDNRNNSQDSRARYEVGFVPMTNIIGKVVLVTFSLRPEGFFNFRAGRWLKLV